MKQSEIYFGLVNRVRRQGLSAWKKHGNYITLNVYDNYCLVLDTYNSSIEVYKGVQLIDNIGSDWGGLRFDLRMTKFWFGHVTPELLKE